MQYGVRMCLILKSLAVRIFGSYEQSYRVSIMILIHLWLFNSGNFNINVICTFVIPIMTRNMVFILQEHAKNYRKQLNELKDIQDKLEQYGRQLCLRIDGVPMTENETSKDVLENVK